MLLKTLSLAGFKSFADRTRLTFDPGVNVVVGPNGSGKSNLLDALAWVMGTQATSALRTQRMDDVIFAGTTTRPSLGRAEVSLTVDNADGFLPLDLAEITMTRRLYRDGTSDYELNGTSCRLLDIQELLSDGGVGRRQHVLVGQGQIGEILSARPEEHRAVIEEAAGVTKHRSRRDRAVRRLEQTDVDVARIGDILDQERRRLRPLKRQANAAERYDGVRARVRALRLWLGGEQLRGIRSRLEAATREHDEHEAVISTDGAELETLAGRFESLRDAAGAVGKDLERDTAAAARLETLVERFERIAMVARERRLGLESRLRGSGERRNDLEAEIHDLEEEQAGFGAREGEAVAVAERRESALTALEDEERALADQMKLPADGLLASLRGDLRSLEAAEVRDGREADHVARRREVVLARLDEEGRDAELLAAEIRDTDGEVSAAGDAYRLAREHRQEAQAEWDGATEDRRAGHLAVAKATARRDAIEGAIAGLGDPAAREQAQAHPAVEGPVVARLDVPPELARAVDAALGSWRHGLVAAGPDGAAEVTAALKSRGLGGVALRVRGGDEATGGAETARSVAATWGLDALVDRLGSAADPELAGSLLGDVVLVEGWAAGWDLVRRHGDVRAVTPEGDLITPVGISLADPDGAGPAALEAAEVAIEAAERELARAESRVTTTHRVFETARDAERRALEHLEQLEAVLAGHAEALGLNERARSASRDELARLEARAEALDAERAGRAERIAEVRRRLGELEESSAATQEAWEAIAARREAVARRRDETRRLREEAAAVLAGMRERGRLIEERLAAAREALWGLADHPVDPAAPGRLEAIETAARDATGVLVDHIGALRERQRALRARANDADRALETARLRRSELERRIASSRDRCGALAIELAELRVREESIAEMLRRDADATEEEALAAPRPDEEDGDSAAETLATLEARLRRMGPVNPLAAAEYRELAARVGELEEQLADLESSRGELRKVIAALDEEMAAMFLVAFEEISDLYQENFGLVFPGGRGRLRLTDPGRPLETGVEIEAQPLGKKVGRLSLLSGGERSLAALAFLFAVFRARPSPFYVLDEVEAALDDANLRRFLRLVDTLRGTAQLVIITHQQQTMEAADVLYGVTMEPGESSLVVAKRLERVAV